MKRHHIFLKHGSRVRYCVMPATASLSWNGFYWQENGFGHTWLEFRTMRQVKAHVNRFPKVEFRVERFGKSRHEYKRWRWGIAK